ncbi:AAA family ATPase [Roseospira navarrensis]|uniref:AAA family ATPase n=1 Tax=Roseospira navarrensis TaxID=140058 RepID=A0A7X1ZBF3_9PROT|nr:AAA family ATPase [Roseospira navarrensis]MQX35428.1 AAA family ATPase [Roseospira navarrensis]
MRLRRLDLTRYGKFTDHVLDFGEKSDAPDLHLIYGPNEAGKSTALSAFLDLLYGIHGQTPYNFLHDYKVMQIGAVLEHKDAVSEWVRVKANKNSLRDGAGQPVGEHALAGMLAGLDRDAYGSMFSLDDDTLEQGGETILKSRGDLGQLLFAASAGLSDLSARLEALTEQADAFARKGGRKTELAELKRALDALDAERRDIDVQASDFARRVKARDAARAAYEATEEALGRVKARTGEIARLRQGLGHAATLSRLRAEAEAYDALPEPPAHWADEIAALAEEDARLTTKRDGLDHRIRALEKELADLSVDDAVLALAERIDRLQDAKGHIAKTMESLPHRREERQALDTQIAAVLARLERPADTDPRALVPPAGTVGTLRGLIADHGRIRATLDTAQAEHEAATDRLAEAQQDWHRVAGAAAPMATDAAPDSGPWDALAAAIRAVRADEPLSRLPHARRTRAAQAQALSDALAALAPWTGDAAALAALPVPDSPRLEAWRAGLAAADEAVRDDTREVTRLEAERDRLVSTLDAIQRTTGVVDDETAQARRAARDAAWTAHRAALDDATADAFAAAMAAHDDVIDGRFAHSTEVAQVRQAAVSLAQTKSDLAHARARRDAATEDRAMLAGDLAAALAALGLPEDWSPASLADWLARRHTAGQARTALSETEADIAALEATVGRARDRLAGAMGGAGVAAPDDAATGGADLAALLDAAEAALNRHMDAAGRREAARTALGKAEQEVAHRTRALNAARAAETDWRTTWTTALAGCWLGAQDPPPAPGAVAAMLEDLEALKALLRDRDDKDHRIAQMDHDQGAFVADLGAILADLANGSEMRDPAADPLPAADALRRRLATAREGDSRRRRCREDLEAAHIERAALDAPLQTLARRIDEMTGLFSVETLSEVGAALRRVAERDALRQRLRETAAALVEALRVPDTAAAETALADVDAQALAEEASTLEARLAVLDPDSKEQFAALRFAEKAVADVGGDDRVARLEARRRTLLLEIEDKTLRHLRLRLGIAAATRALSAYRDRHRSAMLRHAARAFATISRGAYTGLTTQPRADGEDLVAVDAGGGSKAVTALSKGTRFQLYLALRVAGYHAFAERATPVPFVADDIMETFDDFRAEEAVRLFAGMAEVGQVIYLTHHRHLCEIARAVCPTVRIHALDGPAPAAAS